METTAAIYARVSTEEQSHNYSLGTQIESCRKLAEAKGLKVPEGYVITDDKTGTSLERPGLKKLQDLVDSRLIGAVVCHDPDRLSRKLVHLLMITDEWRKQGIDVCFVLHPMEFSAEGNLFFQLRGVFAEYEREKILERTRRGRRKRTESGKISVSKPHYGFSYSDGSYEINEEEAQVVRTIWSLFREENLSVRNIGKRLLCLGILSPKGNRHWWNSEILNILTNPVYGGVLYQNRIYWDHSSSGKKNLRRIRPQEEWIPMPVPPIVPMEWIAGAKMTLSAHKHSTGHPKRFYLLSGLGRLFCHCGKRMSGAGKGRKHGEYRYYRCSSWDYNRIPVDCCKTPLLNADLAEEKVWSEIERVLLNPEVVSTEVKRRQDEEQDEEEVNRESLRQNVKEVENRLRHLKEERQELVTWGLQRIFGEKTRDIIRTEAKRLEQEEQKVLTERKRIEARLQAPVSEKDLFRIEEICRRVGRNLDKLEPEERKKTVSLLVDNIVWDGGTIHLQMIIPSELERVVPHQSTGTHPCRR